MEIGIQLYTVRDHVKDLAQLRDTLRNIRAAGYTVVETAGFCGLDAAGLADELAAAGLRAVSTHTGLEAVALNLDKVIADQKALGAPHVSVPGIPGRLYRDTPAGFTAVAEVLDAAADKLEAEGMTISYHNHTHEFAPIGTSCGLAYMLNSTKKLHMQLDIGHCFAAHEDPTSWLWCYNDRIVTAHYKDTRFVKGVRRDLPIGEGDVDWKAATEAILRSPCQYMIVEHEEFPRDIWDILKTSCDNIKKVLAELA